MPSVSWLGVRWNGSSEWVLTETVVPLFLWSWLNSLVCLVPGIWLSAGFLELSPLGLFLHQTSSEGRWYPLWLRQKLPGLTFKASEQHFLLILLVKASKSQPRFKEQRHRLCPLRGRALHAPYWGGRNSQQAIYHSYFPQLKSNHLVQKVPTNQRRTLLQFSTNIIGVYGTLSKDVRIFSQYKYI